MIFQLQGTESTMPFPSPELATRKPDGLLAVGGDLSKERLLQAYSQGIFPWYSKGQPILWWCPDPRAVLYPENIHVSRSLKRKIKKGGFILKIDRNFPMVMSSCAMPRKGQEGTWLLPEMRLAYQNMFNNDYAHSIELWKKNSLVGGLYGLSIGTVFFGESMFSSIPDASKIIMVYLMNLLKKYNFSFMDCQIFNSHLGRMGAIEIPRSRFLSELAIALKENPSTDIWNQPNIDCSELVIVEGKND